MSGEASLSVDVSTLVFAVDATQVLKAREALDQLVTSGDRAEKAVRKVQTASQMAGIGAYGAATTNAAKSLLELASNQGVVETATRRASAASSDLRAQRALEAAAMRELVTATKAYEKDQVAAARAVAAEAKAASAAQIAADREAAQSAQLTLALRGRLAKQRASEEASAVRELDRAQAAATKTADAYARRISAIEKELDPMAAVTITAAERVKTLDKALAAGAITADHHAAVTSKVNKIAADGAAGLTKMGGAAKLSSHEMANLSFQANDVIVALASGQRPFQVLVQQGAQIGQVFQTSAARGVDLSAALKQVGATVAGLATSFGALIGVVGLAVGGVVALTEGVKEARRRADEAKVSEQAYAAAMNLADEAIRGVTISTYKLADARMAAAAAALEEQKASNTAAIGRIEKPGLLGAIGSTMIDIANFRGSGDQAAIDKLKARNASLTAEGIDLFVGSGAKAGQATAAAKLLDELLPKEKALRDIESQRAKVTANLNSGLYTQGQATAALTSLDKQAADVMKEKQVALTDAEKAAKVTAAKMKQARIEQAQYEVAAANSTASYIQSLTEERNALILGAAGVRDLTVARERQLALVQGDKASADRIAALVAEVKGYEEIAEAAKNTETAVTKFANVDLKPTGVAVAEITDAMEEFRTVTARAADDVLRGFDDLFNSIRQKDWAGALGGLVSSLNAAGLGAGRLAGTVGAAGKGLILGQSLGLGTGGAAGLGLSIGGALAGGLLASSSFAGTMAAGIANGVVGLGGSAALAGSLGTLMSSAAFLGPVAAIVALGLGSLLAGKPTNAGAGYDLVSGQLSGNKRTAETESAVKASAQAILQGQDMLRQAGLTLGVTVNGLVEGTRDLSQIYLSNGKTVTAAVGDNVAATEAALRAVLESATYVSDAQKKVADSALAAGKTFDQVVEALGKYQAAQGLAQSIDDAIQGFLDPQGAAVTTLTRAQEERAKGIQAAADAGYLTAEQLEALTGKLVTLNGLELADTMKKFTSSVTDATDAVKDMVITALNDNFTAARDDLRDAYQQQVASIQSEIDKRRTLADSLAAYGRSLVSGPAAALTPEAAYAAARSAFLATSTSDENVQSVSEDFQRASEAYYAHSESYFKDLEAVRAKVTSSEAVARSQINIDERQLQVLQDRVAPYLIDVKKNTYDTVTALGRVEAALGLLNSVTRPAVGANDNLPRDAYGNINLIGGPPVAPSSPYGDQGLLNFLVNNPIDALQGYAAGTNAATPGMHWVGERGPEIVRFHGGEQVIPNHALGGDNGAELAELRRQNQLLEEQNGKLDAVIGELRADKTQRAAIYEVQSERDDKHNSRLERELWRIGELKAG